LGDVFAKMLILKNKRAVLAKQILAVPLTIPGWCVVYDDEDYPNSGEVELPTICYVKNIRKRKKDSNIVVSGIIIRDNHFESPIDNALVLENEERVGGENIFSITEDTLTTENYNLLPITELEIVVKYGFNPEEVKKLVGKKEEAIYFIVHKGKVRKVIGYIRDDVGGLFSLW
jgi:hypothetical protein